MPEQVKPKADPTVQPGVVSTTPPPKKPTSKTTLALLAVLLLVGFGVGVYYVLNARTGSELTDLSVPPAPAVLTLSLTSPAEGELAVNNEVLVKGKTLPETTVVIFTDTDEETVESDMYGDFESTITLAEGINTLVVTAYAEDGQEQSKSMTLVHDPTS